VAELSREHKIAKAKAMRAEGVPFSTIGLEMGVSHTTVRDWLRSSMFCTGCEAALRSASRSGRCGFCETEDQRRAVDALVEARDLPGNHARVRICDAIDLLRSLGFTQQQVVEARAQAIDGCSGEQILESLGEVEMAGAVA
jgi:hypothetical protein